MHPTRHAPAAPARSLLARHPALKFGVLIAVLAAAVGGGLFEAGAFESTQSVAREKAALHRAVAKVERAVGIVELPPEYRSVQPAGVEGHPPPAIPPSETWPAQ